ncbi:hypothetical protein [Paenibacillus urinalis]|uniref:Uncharacterized protein n=1 Tax=Paenibacillus urinalis TaxID=521520 RepID=A0AAX3N4L5_9BACL|nr:hypothetical protein [Paenibacillus urinalis]WDH84783.1 hypothetical protein PUW23_11445 [Paenibacillus urinalis]
MKKRSVRICPWILTIKVESEESKGKKARTLIRHRAPTAALISSSNHSHQESDDFHKTKKWKLSSPLTPQVERGRLPFKQGVQRQAERAKSE